jgi:hypothetical protein
MKGAKLEGKADDSYADFRGIETSSKGQLHDELAQGHRRCKPAS